MTLSVAKSSRQKRAAIAVLPRGFRVIRCNRRLIPATFSGASGAKPRLFATGLGGVFLGQGRSEGQAVVDGDDHQHDQADRNNRMHDEHDLKIKTGGSNAYPPNEQWARLMQALRNLTGKNIR